MMIYDSLSDYGTGEYELFKQKLVNRKIEEILQGSRQLRKSMGTDIEKVGPKGYIHGWIKVGPGETPSGSGHEVHMQSNYFGHVLQDGKKIGHVGLQDNGKWEASFPGAERPISRNHASPEEAAGAVARRFAKSPPAAGDRSKMHPADYILSGKNAPGGVGGAIRETKTEDLKAADKELTRRAAAGRQSASTAKVHQRIKDELKNNRSGRRLSSQEMQDMMFGPGGARRGQMVSRDDA